MSRFKDLSPIHETEDYGIYVGEMEDQSWVGQRGYLLGNKNTGVVEGEMLVEYLAYKAMLDVQEGHDATFKEDAAPVADEDFEEVIKRLQEERDIKPERNFPIG